MAEMKDVCSVSGPLSQRIPSTLLVAALHKMPFHSNFMCSDALPLRPPGLGAFWGFCQHAEPSGTTSGAKSIPNNELRLGASANMRNQVEPNPEPNQFPIVS